MAAPEYGAPNYFALTRLLNSTRGNPPCRTTYHDRVFRAQLTSARGHGFGYTGMYCISLPRIGILDHYFSFWVLLFYIKKYFLSLEIKINMFKWNY